MRILKYDIRVKTLLQRGLKPIHNDFFIALITGYQGSGKTWFGVMLASELTDKTIVTNIKSLKIPNRKIIYFTTLQEIYNMNDKNALFLIDEVSKAFTKESKQDRAFYSWLQQSRKHNRYVYLITQEYIQVPTWLRGVANKVYTTKQGPFNTFITSLGKPVLNEDTKEWETENYLYFIYKRTKKICSYYDTFELVDRL